MAEKKLFAIKIVIIGPPAVGKTSLIKKFVSDQFSNDYRASIGTNLFISRIHIDIGRSKSIKLEKESKEDEKETAEVKIQIWDIAGHEKWATAVHTYYSGAQGALLVADLTRKKTLEQLESYWYPEFRKYCSKSPVILLANKSDLKGEIQREDVELMAKKLNVESILFTSAKTGENVIDAFKLLAENAIIGKFQY